MSLPHKGLGTFIRDKFGLWSGNTRLMKSCQAMSDRMELHEDSVLGVIIRALWEQLRATHSLRRVGPGLCRLHNPCSGNNQENEKGWAYEIRSKSVG